ncbi:DNA methyltransferase [Mycobacterium phage DotProduct]|uniref:DNA (cytosine-5-)-methyltransferase n=1 Tax=Mycobacterium phage DotProduct TaxID=2923008 RepID=G8J7R6_9CAUD|nr:DNA methyltransferase [Mycobacterium phage DotProduct]AER14108.1 hypothetical protein DOTPRODUCT_64 [Mycobacterium phage DotProduct]
MKLGSLFSGAGGLDIAAEQFFGARTVWHCELNPAASKVLAHRWPGVPNLGDITAVDWSEVEPVDILAGGFPCQDVSAAGRRAGIAEGTRSGLWALFAEVINQLRPGVVVIENVRGLLSAQAHRPNGETNALTDRPCLCGGADRRRGMHTPVRVEEHLSGASDDRDDRTSSTAADAATRRVGRIADDVPARNVEVVGGVGVDTDGHRRGCAAERGAPVPADEVRPGSVGAGSGARAGESATSTERQRVVDGRCSGDVRGDQTAATPAELEGDTCPDCGGCLDGTDRNVESAESTVGDGADGPVLRALGAVLGDLSDLGYDAQWTTVAASAVGAPHKRERVFIVAHPAGQPWRVNDGDQLRAGRGAQRRGSDARSGAASNTASDGRNEGRPEPTRILGGPDAALRGDGPVDLLPTPVARDFKGTGPADMNRNSPCMSAIADLLPTPSAADGNGGHMSRSGDRGDELLLGGIAKAYDSGDLLPTPRARDGRGLDTNPQGGPSLPQAVDDLLPTPNAQDGNGGRYNSDGHQNTLPGTVRDLLPTPSASDGTGGGQHPDRREGHSRQLCDYALLDGTSRWGKYAAAIARWEAVAGPAPSPTEPNKNGNPRLAAAFPEWMMGWPAGWVTEVPALSRNDALRIIGNGVCPQQAYAALQILVRVSTYGVAE